MFLSGCVLTESKRGNSFNLPALELQGNSSKSIAVGVLDDRPYIVSGDKPSNYIAQFELAMGGPYDAFTTSKRPMTEMFFYIPFK